MPTTIFDQPEIEYLDGSPHPKVSPKRAHSLVQGALYRFIHASAADSGSVGPEWRFRPGAIDRAHPTVFVPDVAFVSRERLKTLRGVDLEEPPFSPDIAVEVRSPDDNLSYLADKIARYLATGSILVLDVDPKTRTIHAHASSGIRTFSAEDRFAHDAVHWLQFDVSEIFAELDQFHP